LGAPEKHQDLLACRRHFSRSIDELIVGSKDARRHFVALFVMFSERLRRLDGPPNQSRIGIEVVLKETAWYELDISVLAHSLQCGDYGLVISVIGSFKGVGDKSVLPRGEEIAHAHRTPFGRLLLYKFFQHESRDAPGMKHMALLARTIALHVHVRLVVVNDLE